MLASLDEASSRIKGKPSMPQRHLLPTYGFFSLAAWGIYEVVAERHFASVLTISVVVQLLALALLALQVLTRRSSAGISQKMLGLYATGLCFKLSSTLFFNGYLPVDASGDFLFQAVDVCSLCCVIWLLHTVRSEHQTMRASDKDTFPVVPTIVMCLIVAALMHGDLNARPLFDMSWMAGLLLDLIAVAPQLWLITLNGGRIEGMTGHHVAAMVLSRMFSFWFFWEAWGDPHVAFSQHTAWTILIAHLLHFVLVADFVYFYARSMIRNGLGSNEEFHTWHSI